MSILRHLSLAAALSLTLAACGGDPITDDAERAAQGAWDPSGYPNCTGLGWSDVGSDDNAWKGLKGSFLRMSIAPLDEVSSMNVLDEPTALNHGLVPATYKIGGILRSGKLQTLPSNPAIGPVLNFEDAAGTTSLGIYAAVKYVRSAWTGKITGVCLGYLGNSDGNATGTRQYFMMSRYGL